MRKSLICSSVLTFLIALMLSAFAPAPVAAVGTYTYWIADTEIWNDVNNWSAGIPSPNHSAIIDNDGTALINDGGLFAEAYTLALGGFDFNCSGTVSHSAGTLTIEGELGIGNFAASNGTYNLSGTGQLILLEENYACEVIGLLGVGEFNQDGGTHFVGGGLYVTNGTYNLNDGSLTVIFEHIISSLFNIRGGSLVTNDLVVGSTGTLDVLDSSADIEVKTRMVFYNGSQYSAAAGTVFHMTGTIFENESNTASDLEGLGNTTFVFEGGESVLDTFEVAGIVNGGFVNNFALGGLILGGDIYAGHLQLIDDSYNGSGDNDEGLFVYDLDIHSESSLDVNGLALYEFGDHTSSWEHWISEGELFDSSGASLIPYYDSLNDWTTYALGDYSIPEPGTILLIGCGLSALAGIVRRKIR